MPVILTTEGIPQLEGRLNSMAERVIGPQPIFELVVEDMRRVEKAVFSGQGRRGGGSWAFLQEDTELRKLAHGGSPMILIDTGALLASVTEQDAEYANVHITDREILFGTDRPGARAQQFGDPKHNLSARPFLDFTRFDLARWTRMLAEYFVVKI